MTLTMKGKTLKDCIVSPVARTVPQPVRTQSSNDTAEIRSFRHGRRLTARLGAARESLTVFSSVDLRGSVDHHQSCRVTLSIQRRGDATISKLELKSNSRYLNIGSHLTPPIHGGCTVAACWEEVTRSFGRSRHEFIDEKFVTLSTDNDKHSLQRCLLLVLWDRERHATQ
jgi:hypothetical protein